MREPKMSYAKAQNTSRKLYKRLSKFTGLTGKGGNLKFLVERIIRQYKLNIKFPENMKEAIAVAEDLFDDDVLKLKMGREISSRGSPIESRLAEYLEDKKIKYKRQYRIGRYRVDFFLPDYNTVIECQGYAWHQDPKTYEQMERDLIRRNALALAGYRVLWYSGRQIYRGRKKIIKDIYSL